VWEGRRRCCGDGLFFLLSFLPSFFPFALFFSCPWKITCKSRRAGRQADVVAKRLEILYLWKCLFHLPLSPGVSVCLCVFV
jgi:hypothetical protein